MHNSYNLRNVTCILSEHKGSGLCNTVLLYPTQNLYFELPETLDVDMSTEHVATVWFGV